MKLTKNKLLILLVTLGGLGAYWYFGMRPKAQGGTGINSGGNPDLPGSHNLEWATDAAETVFNAVTGGKKHDGNSNDLQTETATYLMTMGIAGRKALREKEYQLKQITKLGKVEGLPDFQQTDNLPMQLKRDSTMFNRGRYRLPGQTSMNGNPAVIASLAYAIQHIQIKKPEISLVNYGVYNPKTTKWHKYGCALDVNHELGASLIYTLRVIMGLNIQWCSANNEYWISDKRSSAGAKVIDSCVGSHHNHLHIEITPNLRAWQFINMVNWELE